MHKISHFNRLRQMYIAGSCPSLDIGIKISGLSVGPSVIDPNEGCCITRCTFCWHISFPGLGQVEKTHQEIFSCIFIWWHRKKSWRFEGKKCQDAIYVIKLCKYLNSDNESPIDLSIRFLCDTSSVRDHGILQNEKCLRIFLKGWRTPLMIA